MMDLQKIVSQYSSFSPELQKAAKYLLNHPQDVVVFSMRALGEKANVKASTLLRLAKQLGFNSWIDLKAYFIDNLGLRNKDYSQKARTLLKIHDNNPVYQEISQINKENIDKTAIINQDIISYAVDILNQGQSIYIIGFRASFPIAYYLYYVYRLFKKEVYLIDGHAGNLEMLTREITPQDVVVSIGFEPYSQETVNITQSAKRRQCKIITITDSQVSPLALNADISLYFSIESSSFFPSIVSGMGLIEALLALLMAKQGEIGINKLENVEKYFAEAGSYVYKK